VKRFTDTEKWRDPWFRKLTPEVKLFWLYLCDNCDASGVIDIDRDHVEFSIGSVVDWETTVSQLKDRLVTLSNGKLWLKKFIAFQYGELSDTCKPHLNVIKTARDNGLEDTLLIGYAKGIHTPKEKEEDKEKEKEQDKEGSLREGKFSKPSLEDLRARFTELGVPVSEAERFLAHYESNGWKVGKNPMKSWKAACVTWKVNYMERNGSRSIQKMRSAEEIDNELRAKEQSNG
jgi:hypothetical protein